MAIIIAEIGENHCGDMKLAKELINVASEAGCDYAKFQLYNASETSLDDPEREWFKKVQLNSEKLAVLADYCRKKNIKPLCTPWDKEKAKIVFSVGIKDMKIASFHIINKELLEYVNSKAEKVFVSTGMSNLTEISQAVDILDKVKLYLLHCVSEYPLSVENVNLKIMDTLKESFCKKAKIGYSDHTVGILAPIAAVARGAEVIEKHITLDKNLPGTDHVLSANPKELKTMVEQIRTVERILGNSQKKLTEAENKNQKFLRERFTHKR